MSDVPAKITIDRKRHIVLIDDVEFPWMLAEDGPEVSGRDDPDSVTVVTFPVFASEVEIIPECEECDRLDKLGVDYSVITNGFEHIRHIPEVRNQAVVMRTESGQLIGNPDVSISNVEQHDDGSVTATLTPSDGEWRTAGRTRD